jgi:Tfp pilus assembly protein PilV
VKDDARDAGTTLVEVLIAILIMAIIIVPLTAAFVLGLGRTTASLQDAGSSADTQVLAAFFESDVAQSTAVSTSGSCGSGPGRTILVTLSWLDGTAQSVAYVAEVDPDAAAQAGVTTAWRVERVACGPENSSAVVVSQAKVLPSATCDGGSCASGAPRRVSLFVSQLARQITGDQADGSYSYTVTGTRKVTT